MVVKLTNYINSIKDIMIKLIPEKYRYKIILIFGMILGIEGYITERRLITFSIVLLIISIYKILHKNINIINKYVKLNQEILLKIYKYKNPIIGLIIKIELKLSNIMYKATKNDIKNEYKKIIYNILYNFTGFNGIKIILYKIYNVLYDGKKNTIYEIIFKRIYGMILSVLIFTNLIQIIITLLTKISTSYVIGIYIFLILISYIAKERSIEILEFIRKDVTLIGSILIKEGLNKYLINTNLNSSIGLIGIKEGINYENYLKYLILSCHDNIIYYKPSYIYCDEIQKQMCSFYTGFIFTKNAKLKKQEIEQDDINVLNYCEYNILLYKLCIFYIGDVEKALNINETLIKIENQHCGDEFMFNYAYNDKVLKNIYNEKIDDIKLDKFGDLIENKSFYEKMHNYLYDYKFKNTIEYEKLKKLERSYYVNDREDYYIEDSILVTQKTDELLKQMEDFRKEGKAANTKNMEEKYYNIFKEIDIIKKNILYNENINIKG